MSRVFLTANPQPCPTFCNPIPKGKDGLEPILAPRVSGPGYFLEYNPISASIVQISSVQRDQEPSRAGQLLNLHLGPHKHKDLSLNLRATYKAEHGGMYL